MKFIAVDWGSSSFRAWLTDDEGQLAERVANRRGVLDHNPEDFETTLLDAIGAWLERWPGLPVIMAGMIGSRNGWQETPYLPCPVDSQGLGRHLCTVTTTSGLELKLVPGVSGFSPSGAPEVMRGEEVQIFGALALAETTEATVCLPGTHSKWALVDNGSILRFSTFFTGELFALLQQYSSVAALGEETAATDDTPVDEDAFLQGVAYSRQAGGLLHHVFSPRARVLTGNWSGGSLSDYLSGLIIGHEFAGASVLYPNTAPLLVVGNARLQALYQLAASGSGRSLINIDADQATLAGLRALTESSLSALEE